MTIMHAIPQIFNAQFLPYLDELCVIWSRKIIKIVKYLSRQHENKSVVYISFIFNKLW